MSQKDKIDVILKVIATIIAIFGVWKYFDGRSQAEIVAAQERSLGYVERFGDSTLVGARRQLLNFWQEYPQVGGAILDGTMTSNSYRMFVSRFYRSYPNRKDLDNALFRITVFFDELYYCRNSSVCDSSILDSYFCDYAERFSSAYAPFYEIISNELGSRPVNARLTDLAATCKEASS